MVTWLTRVCALAVVGFLFAAGYFAHWSEPRPDPGFIVAPMEHDLGNVPLGTRTVAFAIANPAERPRRIIGLAEG